MIRGLTRAGVGDVGSNADFIRNASQYAFGSVDLNAHALIEECGLDGAIDLLQRHEIIVGSIDLSVEWRKSDTAFQNDLIGFAGQAAAAAALGCTSCCTYILPSTDQDSAPFMAKAVKRLRVIAEVLDTYEIRLGLEFVGPHHLRTTWKNPFIWTVQDTLAMINAIGSRNVGLLLDAYHCHTTGFSPADITRLTAEQIVHVHINDAYDIPPENLLDNNRLHPGEGVIDLLGIIDSLRHIGYNGVVAQEVLTPESPQESAEQLLIRSKAGFDKFNI